MEKRNYEQSKKLDNVCYDIRGPVMDEAIRMEARGANILKLNNGDMKAVQGETGHAQLKMVSDVYSHILDEDRRYNAEKMERDFYKKAEEKVSTEPTAKPTNAATEQLMNLLNSSPDLAAQLLQMLTANQTGQAVTA